MAGDRRRLQPVVDGAEYIDMNPQGIRRNMSAALDCIYGCYKEALDRLPPDLIPSLLNGGFCFGFVDPVSNIIANTVFQDELSTTNNKDKKRKRSSLACATAAKKTEARDTAITKIISESCYKDIRIVPTNGVHSIVPPKKSSGGRGVAALSLRGLVAFLTCYFRYLTYRDALHYLRLSKADLVVAVRLIEEDRASDSAGAPTFNILDLTVEIAIGCAAIAAEHLEVAAFVSRSLSLARHLDDVLFSITDQDRVGRSTMKRLSKLLSTKTSDEMMTTDPWKPMQQGCMLHGRKKEKSTVPAGLQTCLQRVLLDQIHVLYLAAISCIPKDDLRSRHHRGLLKAGHCYGPCDPVANIILNSIWYDTLFPAENRKKFEVEMICTKSLARIECSSLHGLVAFVRVQHPTFSEYEAMRHLLNSGILDRVTTAEGGGLLQENNHFSESDAYDAAARASSHPSPTALVEFATGVMPVAGKTLHSILEANRMLTSSDVATISNICSQHSGGKNVTPVALDLSMDASEIIKANRKKFKTHQRAITKRVEAALARYAQQEGRHEYELHVICDVNSEVREDGRYEYYLNRRRPFSHINILARRKGPRYAGAVPTLFVIECAINDADMQEQGMAFLCCPVPVDPSKHAAGRCFHCESKGIKIVHPPSETYLGRRTEFEDMVRGKNPMSNESLVRRGGHETTTACLETLEVDDSFYFDAALDDDFATYVNEKAAIARKERDRGGRVDLSWLKDRLRRDIVSARKKYKYI